MSASAASAPSRSLPASSARRKRYLEAGAPVGEHLADQLLIPLALAGGGSYTTVTPTPHTTTNIEVVKKFLPVEITTTQLTETCGRSKSSARGGSPTVREGVHLPS